MDADRAIELLRQRRLVWRAEVAAPLEGQPLLLQDLRRLVVRHARERALHLLELAGVALENLQFLLPALEHALDDRDDEPLGQLHHVVERRIRDFGLDHPELGQVTAGLGLLGAERRTEAVGPPERHRVGLVIELSALREVRRLVVEVLHRKERRRAFARRRREDRRIGEDEAAVVEEVAHGVDDFVANPQDRLLARRADPQVAAIHQVVDAVLLRRDGIVLRLGHDLEAADVELEAAGRPGVGAGGACHRERALLRQMVGAAEGFLADGGLRHDALDEPGAVAQRQEMNLAARPAVVQPAAERDGFAGVRGNVFDVDVHA